MVQDEHDSGDNVDCLRVDEELVSKRTGRQSVITGGSPVVDMEKDWMSRFSCVDIAMNEKIAAA